MKGTQVNGDYTRIVSRFLSKVGMKAKFMAVSGDPGEAAPLGGKVLGLGLNLAKGTIEFQICLNLQVQNKRSNKTVRLFKEDIKEK